MKLFTVYSHIPYSQHSWTYLCPQLGHDQLWLAPEALGSLSRTLVRHLARTSVPYRPAVLLPISSAVATPLHPCPHQSFVSGTLCLPSHYPRQLLSQLAHTLLCFSHHEAEAQKWALSTANKPD